MSNRRVQELKFWMGFCVVSGLALILWRPVQRVLNVAAVQNAVQRDWEIGFGSPNGDHPPPMIGSFFDSTAEAFFNRFFPSPYGYPNGDLPAKSVNRTPVYIERFRAFFRPPIQEVHVFYFEALCGDLGAALTRFPQLRRVTVVTEEEIGSPTEADWKTLCTKLRSLPHLEKVVLGGAWMTDTSIAPLSGHPQLRKVSILYGHLTPASTKTFASMPHLIRLELKESIYEGEMELSHDGQKAMRAALPAVKIEFP
jgi:hypothetical protein